MIMKARVGQSGCSNSAPENAGSTEPAKGVVVKRYFFVLGAVAAVMVLLPAPARAELLRITPTGVASGSYSGPTDPVPIGSSGFRLTYHGGGNDTLVDPVLLILGIPGANSSTVAPTIAGSGQSKPVTLQASVDLGGTSTVYGGQWNTTTGFAGVFDSSAGNKSIYQFIGLDPEGSSSENFTNWSKSGDTSWGLFVYALTFTPDFKAGNWIEFTSNLPTGTFVVGYGCDAPLAGTRCSGPSAAEGTPFTFAGHVTSVPEPATLSLLIPGLGLAFARRRKQNV